MMDGSRRAASNVHRVSAGWRYAERLIGSGNGLRQNRYLQQRFESAFGRPLTLSDGRGCRRRGAVRRRAADLTAKKLSKSHIINILKYFAR
ncbi:MAG: hypothetical protein ACLT4C_04790 [Butyricicoccus sp.]